MTFRHLKVFLTVCECRSITAAARKLYVSQPSVSLAIKNLEDEFHVKLFDRISKKLYLTEPGKQLLEQARYLVGLYDTLESGMQNWEQEGVLRVGSSITIGNRFLPAFAQAFQKLHPRMRVKAFINSSETIENMVVENELDLALIEGIPHHKKIVSSVFMDDELVVICAVTHPLAAKKTVTLKQLVGSDLLLREKGSGTRELFDNTLNLHGKIAEPVWESVSTQALIRAVAAGLGVSVLPYWLVQEELGAGTIRRLFVDGIEFKRHDYIIYHEDKFLSQPMRDFIELCMNRQASAS